MCSSKLLSREGNTKFRKGSNDPAQKRTRPKWIRRAECERSLSEIDRKTCSRSARFPSILIAKLFRVMNRYVGNLQPTPRGSGSKVTFCTDTAGQSLLAAFITYDKSYLRIARPHSRVFRLSPGALRREHVSAARIFFLFIPEKLSHNSKVRIAKAGHLQGDHRDQPGRAANCWENLSAAVSWNCRARDRTASRCRTG